MSDWSFTQQSIMQSVCQMQADFSNAIFEIKNVVLEKTEEVPTLRDFFAGCALVGYTQREPLECGWENEAIAKVCFRLADALLKERDKGGE
ncbi:MAG: hypothetical protein WC565_09880 [Parcubacteria group bacterium]|jgi:hypothetical protein|nr:hypothetical protein [Sphaerochaeta sp.]